MPLSCTRHRFESSSLRDDWTRVYENSRNDSPFLTWEFLELWDRCFSSEGELWLYGVYKDDEPVGFLPLLRKRKLGVRILHSLTNAHCAHSGALLSKGNEESALDTLIRFFRQDRWFWDGLVYEFTYPFASSPGPFPESLLNATRCHWRRTFDRTFCITLDKPFEEYFEHLSSNIRKNYHYYKKRLGRSCGAVYRHYRDAEALPHWDAFLRIEDAGWKGDANSSILRTSPAFRTYYSGLLDILARKGCLHLYFLEIDGKPIAGVFGYTEHDTFHYAKTGFDEEYAEFSPSILLLFHIIQDLQAHAPSLQLFHLFPWDHGYKHRYANITPDSATTVVFSPTPLGHSLRAAVALKRHAKRGVSVIEALPKFWRSTPSSLTHHTRG